MIYHHFPQRGGRDSPTNSNFPPQDPPPPPERKEEPVIPIVKEPIKKVKPVKKIQSVKKTLQTKTVKETPKKVSWYRRLISKLSKIFRRN